MNGNSFSLFNISDHLKIFRLIFIQLPRCHAPSLSPDVDVFVASDMICLKLDERALKSQKSLALSLVTKPQKWME